MVKVLGWVGRESIGATMLERTTAVAQRREMQSWKLLKKRCEAHTRNNYI